MKILLSFLLFALTFQQCFVDINSIITITEVKNSSSIITLSKRYTSSFPSFKIGNIYFRFDEVEKILMFTNSSHKNISEYRRLNFTSNAGSSFLVNYIMFHFDVKNPSNITFVYLDNSLLHSRIATKVMSYNCDQRLGIFGMITSISVWTYSIKQIFYFTIFVLSFIYINHEPVKSRSISLILCMIANMIYCFGDYFESTLSYETYSQVGCFIDLYLLYLPQQYTYIIIVFSLLRYILMVNLNYKKNLFVKDVDNFEKSFFYIFVKIVLGKTIFVIVTISYVFIFAMFGLGILGLTSFQCYTFTINLSSMLVLVFCALSASCFFLIVLYDILANIKFFSSFEGLKTFFIILDPFRFRIEHISVLALVVTFILWAIMPILEIKVFLVDLAFFLAFLINGGISLMITIYRQFSKREVEVSQLVEVLQDRLMLEEFVKFMKSEWSIENYLLYSDLQKYSSTKKEERKKLGQDIYNMYLLSSSPFEVNLRNESKLRATIEIELQGDLTFLELDVRNNMTDTLTRFVFTPIYVKFSELKKNSESAKKLVEI